MVTKDRIGLDDTLQDVIKKLAEGNPGALTTLLGLWQRQKNNAIGGFLRLDSERIYGSRIWLLWKDVCGEDPELFDKALLQGKVDELLTRKSTDDPYFAREWAAYAPR